ncbi:hypothetical protein DXG01_005821 [Tephrocybe rancida]|nr:hypothetical protein DXG01_005821 [Tephrocybe rancida]
MPEYRECLAHFLLLFWWYEYFFGKTSMALLALWADASKDEALGPLLKVPGVKEGLVYKLEATSTTQRGTNNYQDYLWPHMWRKDAKNPSPPSIQTLSLKGITMTGRAVTLNLGALYLRIAYLTHTSVLVICKVGLLMSTMTDSVVVVVTDVDQATEIAGPGINSQIRQPQLLLVNYHLVGVFTAFATPLFLPHW